MVGLFSRVDYPGDQINIWKTVILIASTVHSVRSEGAAPLKVNLYVPPENDMRVW